eukprot:CAMPEP_0172481594 /NCGR_PEP_ID=MMETSP1066-20121228/7587_1 /TAXON_ID=671091 /ORGANISM="Coscinodiscus wailesii, Strain CCMP2513" /LENGTH=855 /DNA_ID=CAMNT_0013244041 /DNA_START=305 /DNA_END=2872 /DNA_ORIENTATION=-
MTQTAPAPSTPHKQYSVERTSVSAAALSENGHRQRVSHDHERGDGLYFSPHLVPQHNIMSENRHYIAAPQQQYFRPLSASHGGYGVGVAHHPQQQVSPSRIRPRPSSTGSSTSVDVDSVDSTASSHKSTSRFTFGNGATSAPSGSVPSIVRRDTPTPPDLVVENDDSSDDNDHDDTDTGGNGAFKNSNNDDDDKSSKSPLPQNLRGDPFRSAKVKTELCRNFETEKGCPFGDRCNYAHGAHQLKYTKLIDLERAGLIDVEIFRTHVCSCWVATGACPFDQRCSGLHDPRVEGSSVQWLPHAETVVNGVGPNGVNVDKLYHERLASVYSCSPLYGYVPPKKWKADASSTQLAWDDLYAFACNLDRQCIAVSKYHPCFGYRDSSGGSCDEDRLALELHRVLIALEMRERKEGQCYAYLPSHLLFGELCMVLQARTFRLIDNRTHLDDPTLLEITNDDKDNDTQGTNSTIITAHEIAFGPVGDPGVQQVSLWFNLTKNDIVTCTPQQAKRHKRSRHRLKKNRQPATNAKPATTNSTSGSNNYNHKNTITNNNSPVPFYNYQPVDNVANDFITNILRHRAHVLRVITRHCPLEKKQTALRSLEQFEMGLLNTFMSQRRFWMTWSWPVNVGRGYLDDNTDVPVVNGEYCFDVEGNKSVHIEAFNGPNDHSKPDVLSRSSKFATAFIWKSFVYNMQTHKSKESSNRSSTFSHDVAFSRLRRLPIFRLLSMGIIPANRRCNILPKLRSESSVTRDKNPSDKHSRSSATTGKTIRSLLNEWNTVKEHFKKNNNSPLRNNTRRPSTKDKNNAAVARIKPPATLHLPPPSETALCQIIPVDDSIASAAHHASDDAARSWRRLLPH